MRKSLIIMTLLTVGVFGAFYVFDVPVKFVTEEQAKIKEVIPPPPPPKPQIEKSFHFWHTAENRVCSEDELRNKDIPCEVRLGKPPEQMEN